MSFPQPTTGADIAGSTQAKVGPTDAASAIQVMVAALQSGSERALLAAGTPSADVLTAMELLNGSTTDIGASYLPLVTSMSALAALTATDEWDDVRDLIDAL
jgi:hypothetical protein